MGVFTILKTLVTGSKQGMDIVEKSTNGIIAGIDKLAFTQEEKFDAWKDVAKTHLEIIKATADESTTKSMTRRILAIMLVGSYTFMTLFACLIWKWFADWAVFILTTINTTNFGKLAFWFGIFYVGYYGVSTIIDHTKK